MLIRSNTLLPLVGARTSCLTPLLAGDTTCDVGPVEIDYMLTNRQVTDVVKNQEVHPQAPVCLQTRQGASLGILQELCGARYQPSYVNKYCMRRPLSCSNQHQIHLFAKMTDKTGDSCDYTECWIPNEIRLNRW